MKRPNKNANSLRATIETTCPILKYARDIDAGNIPAARWIKAACRRHLHDLEHGHERGLRWDQEAAQKVLNFFGHLQHTKGRKFAKKKFQLEPWQAFIVGVVFGWKREDGTRRFRVVFVEVPRKNGKSTLAAGIALYLLMADGEPGAEVYSVATKKEQARIVFDEAKRMVAKSPPLRKRIKPYREELRHTKSESVFKPLSSDSKKLDGLNPHAFVADEVHKYESRDIWDVLDTGTGSREQPLKIAITTAGTLDEGIYKELRDYTESVLDGVESEDGSAVKDDAFFGYVGTIDEGDDPESPESWAKANPNWGVTVHKTEMEEAFKRAKRTEAGRVRFLRDRVGLRLGTNLGGIPLEKWDRCKFPRLEKEDDKQMQSRFAEELKGQSCHAALDIANTSDLAALCLTFPRMENGLRYYKQLFWFWCPETAKDSVSELLRDILRPWIHAGYIIQAADDQIDLREIKQTLINASRYYDILDCAFDPHNARQLAGELQEEGIPMFEFTQGIANYNEPCKEYESAIRGRRIQHDGNPAMRWQIGNMVFRANGAGYVMPDRKRSRNKIDGVVAAIMSVARAMQSEGPSVYETRGVEVVG